MLRNTMGSVQISVMKVYGAIILALQGVGGVQFPEKNVTF